MLNKQTSNQEKVLAGLNFMHSLVCLLREILVPLLSYSIMYQTLPQYTNSSYILLFTNTFCYILSPRLQPV